MSGVLQENSRGVIEEGPERGRKYEQQKGGTEKGRTPQHAWRKMGGIRRAGLASNPLEVTCLAGWPKTSVKVSHTQVLFDSRVLGLN